MGQALDFPIRFVAQFSVRLQARKCFVRRPSNRRLAEFSVRRAIQTPRA